MEMCHKVSIQAKDKSNLFHITWQNMGTGAETSFDRGPGEIPASATAYPRPDRFNPGSQISSGEALFAFLDGDKRCLHRALDSAGRRGKTLILYLETCAAAADWPFELLARERVFLLPRDLHLVRCVSDWGEDKIQLPRERPLKLLFMACSPLGVQPVLDYEKEEEAIFQVTADLALDMETDDTGSLEGLHRQLLREEYDVVHLSGHAAVNKNGTPFFIMEDETGNRQDVLPGQLWRDALINNPPRLLFLSGCRTGEEPDQVAAVSFAREIVGDYHVPAVLGWAREVSDAQATLAEKMIYRELSRGKTIPEAVQRARFQLINDFPGDSFPAWPLLRLFSSGRAFNGLVSPKQTPRVCARQMKHIYLEQSGVKVLAEGFVGRRRQVQRGLAALKLDLHKAGVLVHGAGGLGKSCLAGKICERFDSHTLIILHGRLDAVTLEAALKDAFLRAGDGAGESLLAKKAEMTETLARLCVTVFKERNYLLLLDDFEQNQGGAARGRPGALLPEAAQLLAVLLQYLPYTGKMTRLIITGRYLFSLRDGKDNRDLVKERLEMVSLTGFALPEQHKKARELEHILYYPDPDLGSRLLAAGCGNPRLMEWINILLGEMRGAKAPELLSAIKDKQEDFIRIHVLGELLDLGGEEMAGLLQWMGIYRLPVFIAGVRAVAEKTGLSNWRELLDRATGLSLVEHRQAGNLYEVTPLLREDLLSGADQGLTRSCHQAAFAYYKKTNESLSPGRFDPVLAEEWIFHALGCGEEETASDKGGELVTHLSERLAFKESQRVGEWILAGKNQALATADDAFLLNELGSTMHSLGDHRKAIEYYERALAIDEAVFGPEHPDVAVDLNNLGSAIKALGDHRKAIEYFERALAIDEAVFGPEHPDVAVDLNNLGSAIKALGDHRKAIEYYERALAIDEAVFGPEHPDVAVDLNNLGAAYFALEQKEKAKEYFEKAYAIKIKFFGPDHHSSKLTAKWLESCSPGY
jgi:tetratricopeptide (TPR) repeat protein